MTDFPSLIRLLTQNNVEFILIGGAAATAHGSPILTQDLEAVAELEALLEMKERQS